MDGIPHSFDQWKHCIEHDCGIQLTKEFVSQRLKVYENLKNTETKKFVSLYGKSHLDNVVYWFQKIAKQLVSK